MTDWYKLAQQRKQGDHQAAPSTQPAAQPSPDQEQPAATGGRTDWYQLAQQRKKQAEPAQQPPTDISAPAPQAPSPVAQEPQPAPGAQVQDAPPQTPKPTPQQPPTVAEVIPEDSNRAQIGAYLDAIDPALKDEGKDYNYGGAGIMTHRAAGTVDDPEAKMRVYAKARFPDDPNAVDRYGIDDKGEIFYTTDTGEKRFEAPESIAGRVPRFAGELLAAGPEIAGAIAASGLTGGAILPVMMAAGAGEAVRKFEGMLRGDEQTGGQWAGDMAIAAGLAGAGEGLGKIVKGTANKLTSRGNRAQRFAFKEVANKPLTQSEIEMAERIGQIAEREGIQVAAPQRLNRKSLIDTYKYLRDDPRTADYIMAYEKEQADQVEKAIGRKVGELINPGDTPDTISRDIRTAATGAIEGEEKARTAAVSGLYQDAFRKAPPLDISPVMQNIDDTLNSLPEASTGRKAIEKVKNLLAKTNEAGEKIPETDLSKINEAKFEIDDLIAGTSYEASKIAPTSKKFLNRRLSEIKDNLLKIADDASPEYRAAREKYGQLSTPIENLKKSIIGDISKLKTDKTTGTAMSKLLSGNASPEQIARAKPVLEKADPGIMKRAVGGFLRDVQNNLKETETGDLVNLAGKMHKRIFGSEEQRNVLKAALEPQEYQNLSDLFEVFESIARTAGKESATASRQEIRGGLDKALGSRILGGAEYATKPANIPNILSNLFGKMNQAIQKDGDEVFRAMTTPEVTEVIRKMSPLSKNTQRNIRLMTAATAMIGAELGLNEAERELVTEARQPAAQAESRPRQDLTPLGARIR